MNQSPCREKLCVTLACRQFYGSHTYDAIGKQIKSIHSKFKLNVEKLTATVTDNASNFGKAFKEYYAEASASASISENNVASTSRSSTTGIADNSNEDENEDDNLGSNEVEQTDEKSDSDVDVNLGNILQSQLDEDEVVLPSHETCSGHSLNLLATYDANKTSNADITFKRTYRAALAKCTAVWNATRPSSKALEAVKEITNKAILSPFLHAGTHNLIQ